MPNGDSTRRELHILLDHIPASGVPAARDYLRSLLDPVELALLTAPPDSEPITAHEREAIRDAEHRERRGEPLVSQDEIFREFGLPESSR